MVYIWDRINKADIIRDLNPEDQTVIDVDNMVLAIQERIKKEL